MDNVERPLLAAIVPAIAYLISTTSLGLAKSWWLKRENNWIKISLLLFVFDQ